MDITPQFLTEKEVARLLNVGVSSLAKSRIGWGNIALPYTKLGRSVRYARADVEAYMAARRVDPGAGEKAGEVA